MTTTFNGGFIDLSAALAKLRAQVLLLADAAQPVPGKGMYEIPASYLVELCAIAEGES